MSIADGPESRSSEQLEDWPVFELSYLFDDQEEPSEITLFPDSDRYDISTNWITVEAGLAVPLEEMR